MSKDVYEIKMVSDYRAFCNGGDGGLGHPLIWLQIPRDKGIVECPYCNAHIVHENHREKIAEIQAQ